jgi:hypothetical protein
MTLRTPRLKKISIAHQPSQPIKPKGSYLEQSSAFLRITLFIRHLSESNTNSSTWKLEGLKVRELKSLVLTAKSLVFFFLCSDGFIHALRNLRFGPIIAYDLIGWGCPLLSTKRDLRRSCGDGDWAGLTRMGSLRVILNREADGMFHSAEDGIPRTLRWGCN